MEVDREADLEPSHISGDFLRLLEARGIQYQYQYQYPQAGAADAPPPSLSLSPSDRAPDGVQAHGTTVIAVKFQDGVLNVADRRATASGLILYDEAEKILRLDDHTLIAIAGSYAAAIEAVRFLKHSFKYYARSQLQELSLEGKLSEVSRILSRSLPGALQGIGGFLPVVSAYDPKAQAGRIFFYDMMGARFETREFGAAGSGAMQIRGAFDYILRTKGPFQGMSLEEALRETLVLLDIASTLDVATGGLSGGGGTGPLPHALAVTAEGVQEVDPRLLEAAQEAALASRPAYPQAQGDQKGK